MTHTAATTTVSQELLVDRALRQAHESLAAAARLAATSNGEQASRVMSAQFDAAFLAVETLLELRAVDHARTAARFGVAGHVGTNR
ncbi:hypothetical protein [Nocardia sp. NPDC003726]